MRTAIFFLRPFVRIVELFVPTLQKKRPGDAARTAFGCE